MSNIQPNPEQTIYKRLTKFQSEVPNIEKSESNPHWKSKYAALDTIQSAIRPALTKNGLFYTQSVSANGVITTIYSEDGESLISDVYPLTVLPDPQKFASAVTYAKRYSLVAFLGLTVGGEDDDGNEACKPTQVKAVPAKAVYKKPQMTQANFEFLCLLLGAGKKEEATAEYNKFEVSNEFQDGLKQFSQTLIANPQLKA